MFCCAVSTVGQHPLQGRSQDRLGTDGKTMSPPPYPVSVRTSLGLPTTGRGSLAPVGRRVVALVIDWALALLISIGFFQNQPMVTLAIFAVMTYLGVATLGMSMGHLAAGLQIRRLAHAQKKDWSAAGLPGPVLALGRTLLVCLVIPAVVWDSDGRGLHDRVCGTVIVMR